MSKSTDLTKILTDRGLKNCIKCNCTIFNLHIWFDSLLWDLCWWVKNARVCRVYQGNDRRNLGDYRLFSIFFQSFSIFSCQQLVRFSRKTFFKLTISLSKGQFYSLWIPVRILPSSLDCFSFDSNVWQAVWKYGQWKVDKGTFSWYS